MCFARCVGATGDAEPALTQLLCRKRKNVTLKRILYCLCLCVVSRVVFPSTLLQGRVAGTLNGPQLAELFLEGLGEFPDVLERAFPRLLPRCTSQPARQVELCLKAHVCVHNLGHPLCAVLCGCVTCVKQLHGSAQGDGFRSVCFCYEQHASAMNSMRAS
jgi:hypothetical protein